MNTKIQAQDLTAGSTVILEGPMVTDFGVQTFVGQYTFLKFTPAGDGWAHMLARPLSSNASKNHYVGMYRRDDMVTVKS